MSKNSSTQLAWIGEDFVRDTTPYSKYDEVELFDKATSSYLLIPHKMIETTHKMGTHHTQNSHDYGLPNVHTIMYLKAFPPIPSIWASTKSLPHPL